jgi:hypothetical protein
MSKFNIGDEAWYFTFPEDGCGGFDVAAIELHKIIIPDAKELDYHYLHYAYISKSAAIRHLIKRASELFQQPY